MSVFCDYATYYDALYADKDYAAEADYVIDLLRQDGREVSSVLDLGCGTGRHALALAARGIDVTGIDQSQAMIRLARQRAAHSDLPDLAKAFEVGDARSLRLERTYDAVVSLFHVLSYQTSWQAAEKFIATAAAHLDVGGRLVVDFWYGPAVLHDPPEVRVKKSRLGAQEIIRITRPDLLPEENKVDVSFELLVLDPATQSYQVSRELHPMRYWFLPEIRALLEGCDFKMCQAYQWLNRESPQMDSFSVCCVGEKLR